jgi:hypothetical protein
MPGMADNSDTVEFMIDLTGFDGSYDWGLGKEVLHALLAAGAVEGQAVWRRILVAVDELVWTDRPAGAGVH